MFPGIKWPPFFFAIYSLMIILIEKEIRKEIREINSAIDRVIGIIFFVQYVVLYSLGLDENFDVFLMLLFELVPKWTSRYK